MNGPGPIWAQCLFVAGYVNVILAAFNLIPLPPLDGSAVVERLLPGACCPATTGSDPSPCSSRCIIIILDQNAFNSLFVWAFDALRQRGGVTGAQVLNPPGGGEEPAARMARSRVGPATASALAAPSASTDST